MMARQKHYVEQHHFEVLKSARSMIRLRHSIAGDREVNDRLIPFVNALAYVEFAYRMDFEPFFNGDYTQPIMYVATQEQVDLVLERYGIVAEVDDNIAAELAAEWEAGKEGREAERAETVAHREQQDREWAAEGRWYSLSLEAQEKALAAVADVDPEPEADSEEVDDQVAALMASADERLARRAG